MTPTQFDARRSVLKGLALGAGAVALGPLITRVTAEAAGRALGGKRVVFMVSGNGFNASLAPRDAYGPDGNKLGGKNRASTPIDVPLTKLAKTMTPLERHMDRVLIVDDTNAGVAGGHWQAYAPMAVMRNNPGEMPGGITVDTFLAQRMGADAPVPLLAVAGMNQKYLGAQYVQSISALGENQPVTMLCKPDLVAKQLFTASSAGSAKREAFVLNELLPDYKRAMARLAGPERAKCRDPGLSAA
jgi:hypothetical protein